VPGFDALMQVLQHFQAQLDLTAFEFFSEAALEKVLAGTGLARPMAAAAPLYALLEFDCDSRLAQAMAAFEHCAAQGWVQDGTLSQDGRQAAALWRLREDISETLSRWTPYKNDLSVCVSRVPAFLADVEALVNTAYPDWEVICYGHIGDGNVHINILKPDALPRDEFSRRCGEVSSEIFGIVQRYRGSISAEHGVGLLKKPYLGFSRSAEEIALMKQVKAMFDPNGVMNPGKIFD
jgi:FAD/FMN-containing dehydrogenase